VASTSRVGVSVIDWTTIGAPPPIATLPTLIWTSEAITSRLATKPRSGSFRGLSGRDPLQRIRSCDAESVAETADIVVQTDEEEEQYERDPDQRDALVDLAGHRPAADPLDQREDDVAAVERQQRQQIQERQ
jgi:hypothetical protein